MAAVKESSTRAANKKLALICPVTYTMDRIGSYWKPIILYQLASGAKRYSELRRGIPPITEKMLIQHLKQLEQDGIVSRYAQPVVPPHVEYRLTANGEALVPVLRAMANWAVKHYNQKGGAFKAAVSRKKTA